MGTINCPEIRETSLSPQERAQARDFRVRDFERQFNDWTEIAKCCIEVERDQDYKLLGFPSWHAWLLDAAPRSRSYIYLVVGRFKELIADIPEEELAQIPLGSAGVLRSLSSAARKSSKIRQAAQSKPAEFRKVLEQEFPEQHIEPIVECRLRFKLSFWVNFEAAYEKYKLTDETATKEDFVEYLVSEMEC